MRRTPLMVGPMKFYLPEPKMLSKGYWRSTLFSDSSVLKTAVVWKKMKIRYHVAK